VEQGLPVDETTQMELNVTTRKSSKEIRQENKKGTQRKNGTQIGTYGIALDFDLKTKTQHH